MKLTSEQEFVGFLWKEGYRDIKLLPGNRWAATFDFIYTSGIIVGFMGDTTGYEDRWCFHTHERSEAALGAWDGQGEPTGWHRHPDSGRRRVDGDPQQETKRW